MTSTSTPTQYSMRSPAVKRILQEIKELQENPSDEFWAQALDEDIFEWHFTIKGPEDSVYAGGLYHGRILLPPEYPMRPPSIMLLTPNGRFAVRQKICLTITGYHPEYWQPAWGIRTVCMALIGFFPTPGNGSIGSVDWPDSERRKEAVRSRSWECEQCGKQDRVLLTRTPANTPSRQPKPSDQPAITFSVQSPVAASTASSASASSSASSSSSSSLSPTPAETPSVSPSPDTSSSLTRSSPAPNQAVVMNASPSPSPSVRPSLPQPVNASPSPSPSPSLTLQQQQALLEQQERSRREQQKMMDRWIVTLVAMILAIVLRKWFLA